VWSGAVLVRFSVCGLLRFDSEVLEAGVWVRSALGAEFWNAGGVLLDSVLNVQISLFPSVEHLSGLRSSSVVSDYRRVILSSFFFSEVSVLLPLFRRAAKL
jgi:hypothetical protein